LPRSEPARGPPNGSFFHFFGSKKELAGTLFLEILGRYHASVLAAIGESCGAQEGVRQLIRAHLDWVVNNRREARYLFRNFPQRMDRRGAGAQRELNSRLGEAVERWRAPLLERGELLPMTATLFFSQIIGPAQIFCRAVAVGPRPHRSARPDRCPDRLRHPCGGRAGCRQPAGRKNMTATIDPDFAPIETRIRDNVGRQGLCAISARNYPN